MNGEIIPVYIDLNKSNPIIITTEQSVKQYDNDVKYMLSGSLPESICAEFFHKDFAHTAEITADHTIAIPDDYLKRPGMLVLYIVHKREKERTTLCAIQTYIKSHRFPG